LLQVNTGVGAKFAEFVDSSGGIERIAKSFVDLGLGSEKSGRKLLIGLGPLLVSILDFNVADATFYCAEEFSKFAFFCHSFGETLLSGVIH
jgi:hypothetical protein